MKYEHIVRFVQETPWAILPGVLGVILDLVRFRAAGGMLTQEEIEERIAGGHGTQAKVVNLQTVSRLKGVVSVLPLYGILVQRANLITAASGGTSTERFATVFRQAVSDPNVKAVVIDVDSPGGSVFGVEELASEINAARGTKPIIAVGNSIMASAAYWIGSAADEIVVTPGGQVGSIGVLAAHTDFSKHDEMMGIRTTLISAGKHKAEGNEFEPLSEEALGAIQGQVEHYYSLFVGAVARHRGVGVSEVRNGFGEGRMVNAKEALALGMVDRIATLGSVLQRMGATNQAISTVQGIGAYSSAPLFLGDGPPGDLMATAVPPHTTPKAPEEESWEAPILKDFTAESWEELSDGEKRRIATHGVWTPEMPPERFTDIKGFHHRPSQSGIGAVVWRAVSSGRMMQMDIPSGDWPGVRAHLGRHYEQFDKTPPWEEESEGQAAVGAEIEREKRIRRLRALL